MAFRAAARAGAPVCGKMGGVSGPATPDGGLELRNRSVLDDRVDPSREDPFVRGVSEAVGGPPGEHAARRPNRAAAIIVLLALLTFTLHWIQKSPCMDGAWGADRPQYTHFCYTDVLALYYAEHLSEGKVPYFD